MRVFTGKICHECNSFAPGVMEFEDLERMGAVIRPEKALDAFRGTPEYLGGIIEEAEKRGIELVPSLCVEKAGPPLSSACLEKCLSAVLEGLKACKDSIDGICFVLHGAGCAEGTDDVETLFLKEFRKLVGPDMPITVPMDLHGNLSPEMARLADGLFGIKEYPHSDQAVAGRLAMKTLAEALESGRRPKTAVVKLPMLISPLFGYTKEAPMLPIKEYFARYVKENSLIDAGFFHGFAYADLPCTGASAAAVAWDEEDARKAAEDLASFVWERRSDFKGSFISPSRAFDRALAYKGGGYVLMTESSDNPGGGAPGDGTHLLAEFLKRDLPQSLFCFICDPEAADTLARAGAGAVLDIAVGGKRIGLHGKPVMLRDARVISVCDGHTVSNAPMHMGVAREFGKTVRLKTGNVEVMVGSVPKQTLDDRLIALSGADINDYRYVAIKSSHHFRDYFESRAGLIIPVETPGIHAGDLGSFEYRRIRRPVFPLDKNVSFRAGKSRKPGFK